MTTTFGRTLTLALLSVSLAAAVVVGINAGHDGVAIPGHTDGMLLQGSADGDEVAAAPDDEGDKTAACGERDCPVPKQELALARIDQEFASARITAPQPQESKSFTALGDDIQPKSKD